MIERVTWEEFKRRFSWRQGEQVVLIGPPGAGKTTIIDAIKDYRTYNIFFGTKKADPLYNSLIREGYRHIQDVSEIKSYDSNNFMLWPKYPGRIEEHVDTQREVFRSAMDKIVDQGGWTLIVDEAKYLSEFLGLRKELSYCVDQLRSNGSSVVCGAQRPAWVPQSVLANATHVFVFKSTNRDDQIKLADVGGLDAEVVRDEARGLDEFEFIYVKTRGVKSNMVISTVSRGGK